MALGLLLGLCFLSPVPAAGEKGPVGDTQALSGVQPRPGRGLGSQRRAWVRRHIPCTPTTLHCEDYTELSLSHGRETITATATVNALSNLILTIPCF